MNTKSSWVILALVLLSILFVPLVPNDVGIEGDDMGWDADTLMEIRVSTTLSEDDRPCLAIDYNYIKSI
jgi:hypothetical protein